MHQLEKVNWKNYLSYKKFIAGELCRVEFVADELCRMELNLLATNMQRE